MNTIHRENLVTAKRGAAVFAAGTAVAAAFFALTACESSSPGGKIEASTSSAVASSSASPGATTPAQGQYGQLAVQILDAIVRGDSATATAHFDRTMRQELTPDKLASNWDAYQQFSALTNRTGIRGRSRSVVGVGGPRPPYRVVEQSRAVVEECRAGLVDSGGVPVVRDAHRGQLALDLAERHRRAGALGRTRMCR